MQLLWEAVGTLQTASPCWTVQRSRETKINSHAWFLLLEGKAMFCKNIYSFSYYYYNSCLTFMSRGWLIQTFKLFEGRRKTEWRDVAFVPYFIPYTFEKQTLCKYKKKHFKFIRPFSIYYYLPLSCFLSCLFGCKVFLYLWHSFLRHSVSIFRTVPLYWIWNFLRCILSMCWHYIWNILYEWWENHYRGSYDT